MAPGASTQQELLLVPRPQRWQPLPGRWVLPNTVRLRGEVPGEPAPSLDWLEQALLARGHRLERAVPQGAAASSEHTAAERLRLELVPSGDEQCIRDVGTRDAARPAHDFPFKHTSEQAYALRVTTDGVAIVAAGAAAVQYALSTLAQLLLFARSGGGRLELPCCEIEDWPDFAARGAMLDVSRDKVPTLETLYVLIDRLARWKTNQLQLYMEHTFAYVGHEAVWRHASPFTAEDIRALDAYCLARHIQLVPNQNSFGHMQRWLVHEPYRALAECPQGFEHPWNWRAEPYGLCATDPASLSFLTGLYDQLLPNFRSRHFNVGLDETIDLGCGRSGAACAARGTERVYLEFLQQVHARVQERGHVMQFWGDIIIKRPDLLRELPRGALALEWGYEAEHPFAEHLALFQQAGLEFYVCPGTSSWNSLAGRTENVTLNIARAALAGKAAGAAGLLVTDWGDHGHLQPLCVSYLGLLLGAALSWNVRAAQEPLELDLPRLLDAHVFGEGTALGRVAYDLGNAYREAGSLRPNASVLFWSLIKPERLFSPAGVTSESLASTLAYVERVSEPLQSARPLTPEGAFAAAELGWVRDALRFACRLGIARSTLQNREALNEIPAAERAELARELGALIERQRVLWLQRNRPGGLEDSVGRLEQLLALLRCAP